MKPILGYWDVRGRANPIRMLLHYVGVDFEDKRYRDPDEWFGKDKIKLQDTVSFPNLPYYIDDTLQLTQTRAILEYLGRKHKLDGENEAERARIGVIFEHMLELYNGVVNIAYPPDVENRKEIHEIIRKRYAEQLEEKLSVVSKYLGSDEWMAGNRLTYVDFFIYDVLDFHRQLFLPENVHKFSNLKAYLSRIENLKGVKEYLNSPAFKPLPIFGPMAMFGNAEDYKATE